MRRLMSKPARAFESQPYLPLQADLLRPLYSLPPPLKWAGGKRWQLPHVRKFWEGESHRRLVEPFCGGLAVALGLKPQRALLNDINPHLFNFYCWVQRGLRITIELKY